MKKNGNEIIIIGGGLTGLALAYYLKKAGKRVLIIDENERSGGVINSISENGFTYETGPTTGVLSSLEITELFESLSEKCVLETANKQAAKRYIWKKMEWHALPSGLQSAITTPLFSIYDKIRILGEPFRKVGTNPDESVAELVKRRLGKSFLDFAVNPFIAGVYAGDPNQLITRYALPKLYLLEQNYGSFVRGAIQKRKEPKELNAQKVTRDVFSVKGGLKNLINALNAEIGSENILLNCKQTKILPVRHGFITSYIDISGQEVEIESANVISTIGGYALPVLLPFVDQKWMKSLAETTYAGVIQVAVGYKNWTGKKLDAFGGLVPAKENRNILGILFPSAIFANRVPEGGALLSVFLGGINKPEILTKNDEEIKQIINEELRITMQIDTVPDLVHIHRYQHAIAQYDIKTGKRYESIDYIQKKFPGLILAGNIRDGIGMSDRVKQAKMVADKIIANN
ncbi:MAG: protoporphyrinogen oxidase [Paludibacteraceae bacterium]